MKEQITSALRKLGPSSPTMIANEIKADPAQVGYHLRAMLEDKALVATGISRGRRYALPDQKLQGRSTPPQGRKPRQHRKAHRARKTPAARPTERFIPTVDVDKRLHIINGGDPVSFSEEQTSAIATLLFQHYEA